MQSAPVTKPHRIAEYIHLFWSDIRYSRPVWNVNRIQSTCENSKHINDFGRPGGRPVP